MDCNIIDKLKSNEVEFCESRSNQIVDFNDSFLNLSNQDLKGDYFLNRVTLTVGIEAFEREEKAISSILSRIKKISKQQAFDVYIYINDNFSFLKSVLEKNGLREIDEWTGLVNVTEDRKCFSLSGFDIKNHSLI